jgi:hypothetical protein
MNLFESSMQALSLAFHRAGTAAMDPEYAAYTGGLIAAGLVVILLLRRRPSRPGAL